MNDETGWAANEIEAVADLCEGFAFANLKELVVSGVMRWLQDDAVRFAEVMQAEAAILQRQMKTEASEPSPSHRPSRRPRDDLLAIRRDCSGRGLRATHVLIRATAQPRDPGRFRNTNTPSFEADNTSGRPSRFTSTAVI